MVAACRHELLVVESRNRRYLAGACDIEWRTDPVQHVDNLNRSIGPSDAFGGQSIDFGKGTRNQYIVGTPGEYKRFGGFVGIKIFGIGLVDHEQAI